jgi:hypothetical protein
MDHHPPLIAPIDPSRIRIDMPDYADDAETDGDGVISWMAIAFIGVLFAAALAVLMAVTA